VAKAQKSALPKGDKPEISREEMLRVVIMNTKQGLFTGNVDYVNVLVESYEMEKDAVATLAPACSGLLKRAETAEAEVASLREEVLNLRMEVMGLRAGLNSGIEAVMERVAAQEESQDGIATPAGVSASLNECEATGS
jgi:hypothetical protein